jgi:hypothetical protein
VRVSLGLKKPGDFTVSEGHGYPLYIISLVLSACGGVRSSFPSIRPTICPVIHPSKFLILEEEDDGMGGGELMATTAIYPNEKKSF